MSLYIAIGSATSALGGPCESPFEMSSRCRIRKTTTGDDNSRRDSIYARPRRSSGFRPSSEKSTITREIAIAHMRQLALTPLGTKHKAEVLSHTGDEPRFPSAQRTSRGRAATLPKLNPSTPDYTPSAPIPIPRRNVRSSMGNKIVQGDADPGPTRPPRQTEPFNKTSPPREADERVKPNVSATPRFRKFLLIPKSLIESQRRDSGMGNASVAAPRADRTREWMDYAQRVLDGEVRGRTLERAPVRTMAPLARAMSWCGGDDEGHESFSETDGESDSS